MLSASAESPGATALQLRRAAFLDRDGVINIDTAYLHRWEDFRFVPGAVEAMRRLHQAGYALVVVTNQSGIARGFYTEDEYQVLTRHMVQALADQGAPLTAVYHCPHHPGGSVAPYAVECDCRKPSPGMMLRAAAEWHLSLTDSILVGDKASDIEAGRAAGVGALFKVASEHYDEPATTPVTTSQRPDAEHADLLHCVTALLGPA